MHPSCKSQNLGLSQKEKSKPRLPCRGTGMNGWEGRTPPPEKAGLGAFFHLPRRSEKILQSRSCAQKFSLEGPSKMPPRPQRRTVFFPRLSPKVWDFKCLFWWFLPNLGSLIPCPKLRAFKALIWFCNSVCFLCNFKHASKTR